ncbi:MAG: mannose-1-phosphate guanylyltransferase [Opitutales bacterium]|nr:mannose-1-phosphate guanylyltransferase [Opitutales bacterium]
MSQNDEKARYVVIMAGGRGERFWPQSRLARPKHLLPIVGDRPMLAQTIERLAGVVPPENILIITNTEQQVAVGECCPELPIDNIIAEPVGRDTAAAVGLATLLVRARCGDATFAMLPADHVIHDAATFRRDVDAAFAAAECEDALITLGIPPTHPATGYGYIRRGEVSGEAGGQPVYAVGEFKEKPSHDVARRYLESGEYLWNAGMFFWRVPVITSAFERHASELWSAMEPIATGLTAGEPLAALLRDHYPSLPKISVDYAIMEKADTVRVMETHFDWDDVGEWPAVARHTKADSADNVLKGAAIIHNGKGNLVVGTGKRLLALVGTEDLMVIETDAATLVCPKHKAQEIKELVKRIGADAAWKHLT